MRLSKAEMYLEPAMCLDQQDLCKPGVPFDGGGPLALAAFALQDERVHGPALVTPGMKRECRARQDFCTCRTCFV